MLSKIESGDKNSLSFLGNPKYNIFVQSSGLLLLKIFELKQPVKPTLIRVKDPNLAFSVLLVIF